MNLTCFFSRILSPNQNFISLLSLTLLIIFNVFQTVSRSSLVSKVGGQLLISSILGDYIDDRRVPIEQLTQRDINKTVELALHFFDSMKNVERNILNYIGLQRGTANHGVYISYSPEKNALERGRAGWVATRSAQMMVAWHCSGM